MNRIKRAIVIGAGLGGLAAALRLQALKYETTVLEKNEQLGGRACVFYRQGYTFDAGPSVITAPFLIDELFDLFGESRAERIELKPLSPWYRFQSLNGFRLDYNGDPEAMSESIGVISPPDTGGFNKLLQVSKANYEIGFEELAHVPFDSLRRFASCVPSLVRLRADRSVYRTVSKYMRHPMLRRAFSLQPLLIGGNPLSTTSVYLLIHYLERRFGVHYATGGTGALVRALGDLLVEQGAAMSTDAEVQEILIRSGRAVGVRLVDGETIRADVVVANADPAYVYDSLLPGLRRRRRWTRRRLSRLRYSMGLYVLYFGARKRWDEVAHHTIILGEAYRETLKDIFDRKILPAKPSLYLHRPTATDPAMAPPGHDAFYALLPVPNLKGGVEWSQAEEQLRERLLDILEDSVLPGLRKHLDIVFSMTPKQFLDRYRSPHGSGFSIQPTLRQSAWFRFHNRSEELDGLYLVGAGTHPGAGIPGVLSSAKVVETVLKREART
jgi:phytoene desaturase